MNPASPCLLFQFHFFICFLSQVLYFWTLQFFQFLLWLRATCSIHLFVPLSTWICLCSRLFHLSPNWLQWLCHSFQSFNQLNPVWSTVGTKAASSTCLPSPVVTAAYNGDWFPRHGFARTLLCRRKAVRWWVLALNFVQERLSNFFARYEPGISGGNIYLLVAIFGTFR